MGNRQWSVADLARGVLTGDLLGREDAMALTRATGDDLDELFLWSDRIRRKHFGNEVRFCSIVAGKLGGCSEDCKWCAQSARHACKTGTGSVFAVEKTVPVPVLPAVEKTVPVPVFSAFPKRTDIPSVLKAARQARENQVACFCVVNSGRRPSPADLASLRETNDALRAEGLSPACASMGELDAATAADLREMGVRRYNHNLETSRRHFTELVTTHTYDDRLATLKAAREAGIELCCGGLFGTGETWADRVELALTLRDEVRPDVVPLNFLSPIPGTPLANAPENPDGCRGLRSLGDRNHGAGGTTGESVVAGAVVCPFSGQTTVTRTLSGTVVAAEAAANHGTRPRLSPLECLHIIALFRFLLPATEIKIAGGRCPNLRDLQSWVFRAGATSLMVGNYLTTAGRAARLDRQMVEDLGMEVVKVFSKR